MSFVVQKATGYTGRGGGADRGTGGMAAPEMCASAGGVPGGRAMCEPRMTSWLLLLLLLDGALTYDGTTGGDGAAAAEPKYGPGDGVVKPADDALYSRDSVAGLLACKPSSALAVFGAELNAAAMVPRDG